MKWLGLTTIVGSLGGWAGFVRQNSQNPYYSGPVSDHFDGTVFFNEDKMDPVRTLDLLKWKLTDWPEQWPSSWDSPFHNPEIAEVINEDRAEVTLIGHATFLIQVNGLNLVTDPVWSKRASPVSFAGPKRINQPSIAFENLPKIDAVLLSHNHYDHLDMATLQNLVARDNSLIVTPLGNDTIVKNSIPSAQCIAGDWDDVAELANGTRVHFDRTYHWTARGTRDRRMSLWCSFTIETPSLKIHHVADTGFFEGRNFELASKKYGEIDLAILPIGAYEPRWFMKPHHMNPEEAVEGFKLCKAKKAIGHHWGTFQLTNEKIDEPRERLHAALDAHGIDRNNFQAGLPGEKWLIDNRPRA